ncbi:hypothetical protein TNCV_4008991 [Trichonephila clavipes]|nr:hypothetical protein TNCV_4008991 [Trichonephila clavipes]
MSVKTVEKQKKLSWPPYLLLRKGIYKTWIASPAIYNWRNEDTTYFTRETSQRHRSFGKEVKPGNFVVKKTCLGNKSLKRYYEMSDVDECRFGKSPIELRGAYLSRLSVFPVCSGKRSTISTRDKPRTVKHLLPFMLKRTHLSMIKRQL